MRREHRDLRHAVVAMVWRMEAQSEEAPVVARQANLKFIRDWLTGIKFTWEVQNSDLTIDRPPYDIVKANYAVR